MAPFRATQTYEYCCEYRSHQLDEADLAVRDCAQPAHLCPSPSPLHQSPIAIMQALCAKPFVVRVRSRRVWGQPTVPIIAIYSHPSR